MTSRREIAQRKTVLRDLLRDECQSGTFAPGSLLAPVRELAERHNVSSVVVRQVLKTLEDEGLLYTIARVGTFVGQTLPGMTEFYLLLLPATRLVEGRFLQIKVGFEERIAQLGGATLVMTSEGASQFQRDRQILAVAGIFDFDEAPFASGRNIAHVQFAGSKRAPTNADLISFNDIEGGRRAACHLMALGHRHIAFLGPHRADGDPGIFAWSAEREQGWRQALLAKNLPTEGLAYHADEVPVTDQILSAYTASRRLVRRTDITAVVTANDLTAQGLINALMEAKIPIGRWPAIIGFDEDPCVFGHNFSSFRLPWDEIGRAAAELLWERRHGQLQGPPQHRQVSMRFIRRFSCQPNWFSTDDHGALVSLHAAMAIPEETA